MEHNQSSAAGGHGRHMLIMALCCLIPLAGIFAISAFGVPLTGVLRYALTLICPIGMALMIVMMMRGEHSHGQSAGEAESGQPGLQDKSASCH